MMPTESSSTPSIAASSSNQGVTQATILDDVGQSYNLQDVSSTQHEVLKNSVGQGMQSNCFANAEWEVLGSHPLQSHQQWQGRYQFLKKSQQPSPYPSFMQSNIRYHHQNRHQQEIQSQPTQLQYSLKQTLPEQQHQRLMGLQSNSADMQLNQQFWQQNSVLGQEQEQQQQVSLSCQDRSNSFQLLPRPQNYVSGVQQQHKLVGPQSDSLNMQLLPNSVNVLQQADIVAAQHKSLQQTLQPVQLRHLLGLQKDSKSLQEAMKQRLQTSSTSLEFQNGINQQKQECQSQLVLSDALPGSGEAWTQTVHATADAWHDQAYMELQTMKEKYLPELIEVYRRAHATCLQPLEPKQAERCNNTKIMVEKMIRLLQVSRNDILRLPKEKLDHYKKVIISFISSTRSKKTVSVQHNGQPLQQCGSQSSKPQMHPQGNTKLQLNPANLALTSRSTGSICLMSTQQGVLNSRPNILNSLKSGSHIESEQGNALSPLQHGSVRSTHQSIITPQQTNSSHNSVDSLWRSSNTLLQHLKQQQKHQLLQQMQKLKQQSPQQLIQQRNQQTLMQKYNINDLEMRQLMDFGTEMHQKHHTTDHGSEFRDQSLLSTTTNQLQAISPQTPEPSSPQIDQENLLPAVSKVGKFLQSATSPLVATSLSTITPLSVPVDLHDHLSSVSQLSTAENVVGRSHMPVAQAGVQSLTHTQNELLATVTSGMSASPLLAEFIFEDSTQQSNAVEQPFERLRKALKSTSAEARRASVSDLGAVVNLIDNIVGTAAVHKPRFAICEDLGASTRCHLQGSDLHSQYGCASAQKMKRHTSAVALDLFSPSASENDSFKQFGGQMLDLESTATSRTKRRRIEPNNALLEEIRHVNQKFVETVIEIVSDSAEDTATTKAGDGTIIRFSYSAVALRENFKLWDASSQMPILPVGLLVPADYPNSSPIVLDKLPGCWSDSEEPDGLSRKAKSRFIISLRNLSEPMSLGELARAWDISAREVFSEFAQLMGGECFSSRYGTWENCIAAS
ncbi:mediator of RNA polymerase II transcription subunit 15a-like isoform X2 [Malania oleifera]|uniref:mediator of RNA polymerase II transcription subunit 15a-like isoform X2 n=1 Tax=Malania oleifera TaxID=397392 RepID=UPI0025AE75B2|nr:mediator of RNA polymerase II transcription subunit 15a-like isoform X2 [Malania oleifera]